MRTQRPLEVNALRILQRQDIPLFVFGVNGRLIHTFAAVQLAHRDREGALIGYQRDAVTRHIQEIRAYLEQESALLPNAVVIALDESARFTALDGTMHSEWGTFGTLTIPLPGHGEKKPGFIVDGQQRIAALSSLAPERDFPVVVVAFQTGSDALQAEQFVLVNKTKPLPRDLLNELLPTVETYLPSPMHRRRIAASVLQRLRFDVESPFRGRIIGLGAGGEGCNISQAAVLSVIERSSKQRGILSFLRHDPPDIEQASQLLKLFFQGVASTWHYAWSGSPRSSRLVHGVGIYAMGTVMEVVMRGIDPQSPDALPTILARLKPLKPHCRWTSGRWPQLRCAWNELQNTSQDKRRLSAYLLERYSSSR
ncbi:MAG: DGQHR domain-containing protein [Gammaproteobacteria bacterium]|nr:DGQHR domain-containing protein [Gammaproteobacteria bacterium]